MKLKLLTKDFTSKMVGHFGLSLPGTPENTNYPHLLRTASQFLESFKELVNDITRMGSGLTPSLVPIPLKVSSDGFLRNAKLKNF